MDLIKDESIKFTIKSALVKYTKYISSGRCQIELMAATKNTPIVLPNGKMFTSDWNNEEEFTISSGDIKLILIRKSVLANESYSGSLSAIGDNIEASIPVDDEYFLTIMNSLNFGKIPNEVSFYVKNSKTDNPAYKALKLTGKEYEISDWCITIPV